MSKARTSWRRWLDRGGVAAAGIGEAAALILLLGPILLVIWLSFGIDRYTTIPPNGYGIRWYENIFARAEFVPAFLVSLKIALIVTPVALVTGTLAAFALNRATGRWVALVQSLLFSPIIIPQVVTGIALLYFFSLVQSRDAFWNIVIGHVIITFPYVVRTVSVALARYDIALDDAAKSLGAKPAQVFWLVTLPLIRPGLFAGALFAFVMSFDDFTVTIFLTGTKTHTLPIAIYHYLEWNVDSTISAVSAVLVFLAVVVMLAVEKLIGLDRFVGLRG